MPWHIRTDRPSDWRPVVRGADREYLETFDGRGSETVTRYVALYRLRATGNRLTSSENRVADDTQWRIIRQGRAEVELAGDKVAVNRSEIVRGPDRGLVWSFYVVDGRIAASLLETKLLQLRAVLHQQQPIGAIVMVEGAESELSHFLAASQPFPEYIDKLRRRSSVTP
jgi:EpsI family protein